MYQDAPKLVIMAAGMGSRFGGLKQMEPVDDEGHSIIDFSMYDARRAGFRDLVFIIKRYSAGIATSIRCLPMCPASPLKALRL